MRRRLRSRTRARCNPSAANPAASLRPLAALTSAALCLPGLAAHAAEPLAAAQGNVQYGHYQESDGRIEVEIYQGDFRVPMNEHLEFGVSVVRDTYSGATPSFSMPLSMTAQPRYAQNDDGSSAAVATPADVISAASGGVSAGGLTLLGGLNTYARFVDGRAAVEAAVIAANPRPPSPPSPPTLPGPVTVNFNPGMTFSSYAGAANLAAVAGGLCPGSGPNGCFYEDGMAVGIVGDSSNPIAHVHRSGTAADRALSYHADSTGIYVRALDGSAFSLDTLDFRAPIDPADNPDSGAADVWEIMGFNSAVNATLDTDAAFPTRVAYQTVANGFDGSLALDSAFGNINAFWITYNGYHQTPTDGKTYEMRIDNVALSGVAPNTAETPEQQAWALAVNREVSIALYQAILDAGVPTGTPTVQRFDEQPRETRVMPEFTATYYLDQLTVGLSGGVSEEDDFHSSFGGITVSQGFNNELTTLSASYSLTRNRITRATPAHDADEGHDHASDHNPTDYAELDEHSTFHSATLGLAQVLSKNTLIQGTVGYINQQGYLSNPYKLVYIRGEITAEEYYDLWQAAPNTVDWSAVTSLEVMGIELFRENRPRAREQWTVAGRLVQYVPALDAALHADYRYYRDDWDIDAHTVELSWHQPLPGGLLLTPHARYYSQSAAEFFAPYFLAPRADGYYSSDYRLSAFGALASGLTLSKRVNKALTFEAGAEYYTHAASLALGHDAGAYADYDSYVAHAALSIDFSAPLLGAAADASRNHSAHGDAHDVPAGVMFAHEGGERGAFMLSHRYQWQSRHGATWQGSRAVDDAAIAASACGATPCTQRATDMQMHMHMLDLSYMLSDSLTIMLMPQVMSMTMGTAPLAGATPDEEHSGSHDSDGLGDTLIAGVFRLAERDEHRLLFGLGLSAPTGSVRHTHDGTDNIGSTLQDYGMQTGSGTWDLRPSLTYTGALNDFTWGAQLNATRRLESRNEAGYALGDVLETSAWVGYRVQPWLSASVRGIHTVQGGLNGRFRRATADSLPADFPDNHGGRYWDVGIGLQAAAPGGLLAGQTLGVEWLQPVATDFNGFQLERDGSLAVTWSCAF